MAQRIQWKLDIQVAGGPTLAVSKTLDVEAYDVIDIAILGTASSGGADSDKEVAVQPGGSGLVKFLALTCSEYSEDLTYKVNNTSNDPISLDQPQILVGKGAVLLAETIGGGAAVTKLFFSSNIANNVSVKILVGRDATP